MSWQCKWTECVMCTCCCLAFCNSNLVFFYENSFMKQFWLIGNRTLCCPILSVILLLINKWGSPFVTVPFLYSYDYRRNWNPPIHISITFWFLWNFLLYAQHPYTQSMNHSFMDDFPMLWCKVYFLFFSLANIHWWNMDLPLYLYYLFLNSWCFICKCSSSA